MTSPTTAASPTTATHERVLALINCRGGSAAKAAEALRDQERVEARMLEPTELMDALRQAVRDGVRRVIVCGGDGTLAAAASVLAGTPVEMGVLPGGTLNHFAGFLKLPTDPAEAVKVALAGTVRAVDVGYVNDRLILNTSSVGAYVSFVHARERFERYGLPYFVASALAFVRLLWRLPSFSVSLEVEGASKTYQTPLVFVGIGERELRPPSPGATVPEARRGLHVVVIRGSRRTRLLVLGLVVAARGVQAMHRMPRNGFDSFVVDACRIEMRRPRGNAGIDGELVPLVAPLEFRYVRDALKVVVAANA